MSNPLYLLKEKQDKPERVEIIDRALKQAQSKIDPFTRARATYYDFMREVAKGFGGVGEGIVDFGAMTIGTVADLVGNKELSQQMQDFIKPDYVNQFYDELMPMQWIDKQFGTNTYKMAKDYFDVSYINELDDNTQQIVRGVGQSLGQVLPMIITYGMASGATQAGALSKGATLAQAMSQGRKIGNLASMGLILTSASGRAGSKALNEGANMSNAYAYGVASGLLEAGVETVSGLIPGLSAIPGIGSVGRGTVGKLIGQGLSEGAEEMVTELLDPLLQNLYKDAEYNVNAQEVLNSGIIGFITGSLLSGGNVVIDTSRFGVKGNKVNGYLMEINELAIEKDKLTRNGKLTVEENMRIDKEIDALYQKILEINDTMTEKDLKAYEGALGKSYEFTSQLVEETNRATGLNIDENTKYEFEPIRAENFTPEQTKKVNEVLNTMSKIQSKTKGTMQIVFTENMNVGENGAYHNNVLYININSQNPLQTAIKHELTHSIENTKSYNILKNIVLEKIKSNNQYDTRMSELKNLYAENIQGMNQQQQTEYLENEMVANALSEEILTDPNTINRICQTNKSLGRKILDWIKSKIKAIKNKAGIDFLRQAEKLYSQALDEKLVNQDTRLAPQYSKSSTDSLGNKLTKEQQEYFKDSKVRDENGNLLVVYHGTSENFTKFDITKSRSYKGEVDYDLPGFYFTANKQEASDYGNVKPFYLNITNPVINELNYYREQYNSWRETYDNLIEKGFDGAIVVEDGEVQEYIAFKPEQIKSIYNKNPTLNPDIRYSKSAVIGETKISTQRIQQAKKINILDWKSVVDGAKELGLQLRIGFINSAAGIVVVGNQAGVDLMPLVTYAQTSSQAGFGYIENGVIKYENGKPIQVAKSPLETLKPVLKNEAIYRNFQTYSYHKHNINRIAQGKPVFGKFLQYSTTIENQLQQYVNQNKLTQDFVDSLKATGYLDEATVNEYLANNTLDNDVKQYIESNTLDISADQSQQIVDNYEKTHPNFKSINEDIVKYFQELLKIQLESGMISQENYDYFMQTYPNYIPTYRVMKPTSLGGATANTRGASVSPVIKKATGSDLVIETLGEGIERVTMNTIRSTRINNLARALYEIKLNDTNNEIKGVEIVTSDNAVERITDVTEIDYDEMVKHDPKSNEYTITFFVDGEKMKLRVAKSVYQGFYSLTGESKSWKAFEMIEKIMTPINTTFKKLTTSLNPIFSMWRNPTRDFGNAVLQTKFGGENLIRNIPKALNMIRKNDPMWKLYQAQGGFSSTIMDFDHGISVNIDQNVVGKAKGKLKLIGDKIEGASRTLEQLFRFTEFLMTLENGGTLTEALYNSAEVTTNFNTGGTVTKWLNRTVAPFLNPSVQGASKFIRTVAQGITPFGIASKSGVTKGTPYFKLGRVYMSKDTFRRWVNFIVQWTLFGLTASILNELLLGDDDDFKSIRDFEKDANYFIKVGDNTFFKIPKGQVIGVAGSFAQRIVRLLKGDENAFDDFLNTASQQMNPIESFRFIWQPIYEVQTNTTWYGGTIENQTLQKYKPSQRYDESTSQIAIELGKILNYSPKKIHYLIDNYTGIIGDLALPSTTLRAEGESIHILNILKKDLITDTVMSNKYSQKFYDLIEQTTYEKNEDETSRKSKIAKAKLRYLNKVNSASSEINKRIKEIQSNPNMSDKDKLAEVKVLKAQLNLLQKEALENVKLVEKNARFFELSDLSFEDDYRELTRITFGSDVALKQYNAKVFEKALALSNLGLDFDTFYNAYFDLKDISEYVSGNIKKQIIYNYINKMRIRKPLKYILYAMQGYKLTDTQLRLVKFYINTKKLSREQKDIVLQLIS